MISWYFSEALHFRNGRNESSHGSPYRRISEIAAHFSQLTGVQKKNKNAAARNSLRTLINCYNLDPG